MQLSPRDVLVLYSDGLTDAVSANGEMYDRERLQSLLERISHLPLDALCRSVFEQLKEHQGAAEQYDDMTLLVVGVEEPRPGG
jgi:sigma-B regulation protein RsbU (phosphoserine phosphatase)